MPVPGLLTKARLGYSMPVDAPLYMPFPLYYEDVRILLFPYLTSAAAAAALVPSQFELVTADPAGTLAIAQVVFAKYPFSNIGAYNEVAQTVLVKYQGTLGSYAVRLHVTSDQAMVAGREIGGFPKRLGTISFEEGTSFLSTLESLTGLPLCTGELDVVQPVTGHEDLPLTYFSLRLIPNPEDAAQPSLCQLIESVWDLYDGTLWSGRGAVHFSGASALNPYHTLPVVQPLGPLNPSPQTELEKNTPGVGLFRGKMRVARVRVLENF